jgi:ribosomal protein S1
MSIDDLKTGMEVTGKVSKIELFGALIDIGVGVDALLHISQLGKENVRNVEDVVNIGDEITAYVLKADKQGKRVFLSLEKPPAVTWDSLSEGDIVEGEVVRVESFGAFVDIGAERPGMVHVSELADGYVKAPSDVVSVGDKVQARVLKVNRKKRQIDLSMKSPEETVDVAAVQEEDDEEMPTAMAVALRKAMEQSEDADDRPNRRDRKRKDNREQEDILSRTLREHTN